MANISVHYSDEETGKIFDLSEEFDSTFIWDTLNVMIDIIRVMGFGDELIEKWLGTTYFEECLPDLEDDLDDVDLDAATDEFLNEYKASHASEKQQDDEKDCPGN